MLPQIVVSFPDEEIKIAGESEFSAPLVENTNEWEACASDEDNKSTLEYKYEEDPETFSIKKYKWEKAKAENVAVVEMKAPINYVETVV